MTERTFSIVKPDAVTKGNLGAIVAEIERADLKLVAAKLIHLSQTQAETFYAVHRERPFFNDLVAFMVSAPCFVSVLEGDDAIRRYRTLMGATDPAQATEGTLRKRFGANIENNAVHGSDGPDTAAFEISYFFSGLEMHPQSA